jgi:serine/threonine protein kinase
MGQIGTTIGRYEIRDELGRGSMGVVHRAHDPLTGREVAIKMILWPNGISPENWQAYQKKLRTQAKAAGRLTHQGIVAVYDIAGDETGQTYIAMEYVVGPTLHELIRTEGALNADWALSVADTLADALQSAADEGVFHPDLKPSNILIRESDGIAKIADFGVASLADSTDPQGTRGTPAYLSPEAIAGEEVDLRSELFSVGVILYEMLCGEPPFGGVVSELIRESIQLLQPVPIVERSADLAAEFDTFFDRALAKKPEDRFQDGHAFRKAIESLRRAQHEFDSTSSAATIGEIGTPDVAEIDVPAALEEGAPRLVEPDCPVDEIESLSLDVSAAPVEPTRNEPEALPAQAPVEARSVPRTRRRSDFSPAWAGTALLLVALFVAGVAWTWSKMGDSTEPAAIPFAALPAESANSPIPEPTATERKFTVVEPAPEPVPVVATPARPQPEPTPPPAAATPPTPEPVVVENPVAEEPPAPPVPAPVIVETAYVEVFLKNSIKEGTLTLLVDGDEVYKTALVDESKGMSRAYKKTLGKSEESRAVQLELLPGTHTISAQVFSAKKSRDYEHSIEVELAADERKRLRIVTGKTFGRRVSLKLSD